MNIHNAVYICVVALWLTGCETLEDESADKELLVACEAYAGALTSLSVVREDLSQSTQDTVDRIRAEVNPICLDNDFGLIDEAIETVEGAVLALIGARETTNGRS